MAARKNLSHPEEVRSRIKTSQLLNRLTQFAFGEVELQKSQVTAILGLLRKTLPDLTAISHSGFIETAKPEDLSDADLAHIASASGNRVTEAPFSEEEPSELH